MLLIVALRSPRSLTSINSRQASSAYSVYMVSKFRSGMARLKKYVGITLYINLIFWRYLYVRSVQIGLNLLWMAPCFVLFCFS